MDYWEQKRHRKRRARPACKCIEINLVKSAQGYVAQREWGLNDQHLWFPLKVRDIDYLNRWGTLIIFAPSLPHSTISSTIYLKDLSPSLPAAHSSCPGPFLMIYTESWMVDLYSAGLRARLITPRSPINFVQRSHCVCPQPPNFCLFKPNPKKFYTLC